MSALADHDSTGLYQERPCTAARAEL